MVRAIRAYRKLPLTGQTRQRAGRTVSKRARSLSVTEVERLTRRYQGGATVYELATEFGIDLRTVAIRLKAAGVSMRHQPPKATMIDEMVLLYTSGLSLVRVGDKVGVNAATVANHLRDRGVEMRPAKRRHR